MASAAWRKESRSNAPSRRGGVRLSEWLKHAFIILTCVLILYPFVLMLQTSLKDTGQIMFQFFQIQGPFHWDNYKFAWEMVSPLVWNSLIMSGGSAALGCLIAALAGYAFAKLTFPFKETLFWIIFAKMLLPAVLNLIPSFVLAWRMGLLDTYWVVILFAIGGAQPFWVFVMRTFVSQQPHELFESARIDGATEFQTFRHLAAPLLKPMLALSGIQVFLGVWNDYIWPLVTIQTQEMRPITTGLAYLTTGYPGDYGPLMAGYALASVPLLLLFSLGMKQFVQGLTGGAIKL